MKQLVEKLIQEAEIDDQTAEKVVDVLKDFLEDKLPKPIAGQVMNYLDGVDSDDLNDVLDNVKGLFGR